MAHVLHGQQFVQQLFWCGRISVNVLSFSVPANLLGLDSPATLESGVRACFPGRLPVARWSVGEWGVVDEVSASSVSENLFIVNNFKNQDSNLNDIIISSS